MLADAASITALAATTAAGVGGACLGLSWERRRERLARKRRVRASAGVRNVHAVDGEAADGFGRVLRFAIDVSHRLSLDATTPLASRVSKARAERWLDDHARKAGVDQVLSAEGFVESMARLACGGAVAASLAGAVLSTELAVLGLLLGAIGGLTALPRAVKRAERDRAARLERDLSEMLEVVALGLRSGLAFDRSFELYGAHFRTTFARECAQAQRTWTFGLATRDDALRSLAASYDSPLFARVVENVVRSLRFGSSLAESFEEAAAEARAVHRTHVEEQVAKAPVKMMVPTGTLILPAMLLLVLGPVLLELMDGF